MTLAQCIPLEPLVAALDVYGWNEEACKAAHGLIQLIIQTSNFPALMEKYESALTAAARNSSIDLLKLAIAALKLGLTDEHNIAILVKSEFFTTVVKRVAMPDAEITELIGEALKESKVYAMYPSEMEELLRDAAVQQDADEAMVVVLELLCSLRKTVPQSSSVYLGLDDYVKAQDLILQLCAIQIIIQNADSQRDFDLLSGEGGIIEYLVSRLPHDGTFVLNEEPVYSKAMTLFAGLARVKTTNWTPFAPRILAGVKTCLNEVKSEAIKDAIFLVGCISANESLQKEFESLTPLYLEQFTGSSMSVQAACLHSLAVVAANALTEQVRTEIVTKGLEAMGTKGAFDNLQSFCCSGLDEVKNAAYACLSQILSQRSLCEQAFASSSLFMFLTNRLADSSPEGLQAKYRVIEALVAQPWATQVLNEPMMGTLRTYLTQGIYYNESAPQVAMQV